MVRTFPDWAFVRYTWMWGEWHATFWNMRMQVLAEAIDHDDVPKILHKKHHPGTIFYLTINGLRTKIEECKKNNYNYAHFEKVLLKWPSKPASQVTTTTKPTRFRKLA